MVDNCKICGNKMEEKWVDLMGDNFMFQKVNIKKEEELWELKNELNKAYQNSVLPDIPDREPFEKYLIKWRIHKLKVDGLI